MRTYRELYYFLARTTERAIRALDQQNIGTARKLLIDAQQQAEECILDDAFEESNITAEG